jgi:hypothetical protein
MNFLHFPCATVQQYYCLLSRSLQNDLKIKNKSPIVQRPTKISSYWEVHTCTAAKSVFNRRQQCQFDKKFRLRIMSTTVLYSPLQWAQTSIMLNYESKLQGIFQDLWTGGVREGLGVWDWDRGAGGQGMGGVTKMLGGEHPLQGVNKSLQMAAMCWHGCFLRSAWGDLTSSVSLIKEPNKSKNYFIFTFTFTFISKLCSRIENL